MDSLNLRGAPLRRLKEAASIDPDQLEDIVVRNDGAIVFWGRNAKELLVVPLEGAYSISRRAHIPNADTLVALAVEAEYYSSEDPIEAALLETEDQITINLYYTEDQSVSEHITITFEEDE